jgi:nicotinamidase-related amidase
MGNPAVVVIDVQNAVLSIPGMTRREETNFAFNACVARIAKLVTRARRRGISVIFVQHTGPIGHRLERNSKGWKLRPELTPNPMEPVIHKLASDSFFHTSLAAELEVRQASRLIVAGCMTQYCIDTTVRRAVTVGYNVTLVADGHMTADSRSLTFDQVIAHHNELLDGFNAGEHMVSVVPAEQVQF